MQRHGIDSMHLVEVNTTLTLPPLLLQAQLAHLTYHNFNFALKLILLIRKTRSRQTAIYIMNSTISFTYQKLAFTKRSHFQQSKLFDP